MEGSGITEGEKKFVELTMLEKRDRMLTMHWVTKKKGSKIEKRLLVVGRFRVYSIKRNNFSKKKTIQREAHHWNLREIKSPAPNALNLFFSDFKIEFESDQAGLIAHSIISSCLQISVNFCPPMTPSQDLCPQTLAKVKQLTNPHWSPGPDDGMAAGYEAACNFMNLPPNLSVVEFIQDLAQAQDRNLNLTACPGISIKTASKEEYVSLEPVFRALRFNRFFDTVTLNGMPRKEIITLMADTMNHNTTIKKFSLKGLDTRDGFAELGEALKNNKEHRLEILQLEGVKMGASASHLGCGIHYSSRGLVELNVSNCDLNGKLSTLLLDALGYNPVHHPTLRKLNFSNNMLGDVGSNSLSSFLDRLSINSPLESLRINNTGCSISDIMVKISASIAQNIVEIDLSNNRMDREGCSAVSTAIGRCQRLSRLKLNGCKLIELSFESICTAIQNNKNLSNIKFDLEVGNNLLGMKKAEGTACVQRSLTSATNLASISLRENKFRTKDMMSLLDSVKNSNIKRFDFGAPKGSQCAKIMPSLITLVSSSSLESLCLSGCAENEWGRYMAHFVEGLQNTRCLKDLDISNNRLTDRVVTTLLQGLQRNSSILQLKWDNNGITLDVLRSLKVCLAANTHLSNVEFPQEDCAKFVASSKDKVRTNTQCTEVWNDISTRLRQNRDSSGFDNWARTCGFLSPDLIVDSKQIMLAQDEDESSAPPSDLAASSSSSSAGAAVPPVQMGSSRSGTLSNSGSAEETPASPKDDPSLNRSTSSSAIPRQGFTAAVPSAMSLSRKDTAQPPRSSAPSPSPTSVVPSPSASTPSPLAAPSRQAETKAAAPSVEPKLEREEEVYEEEEAGEEEEEEIEEIEVTVQPKKKFWQTGGMQIGMIASELNQKNIPRIATTMMSTGLKPEDLEYDYGDKEEHDDDNGDGGKEDPLFLKEVKPLPSGSRRNAPAKRSADTTPHSNSNPPDGHKASTSTRPAAPVVGAGRGGPGAGGFGRGQGPQPPSGGFRGGLGGSSPGPTRGGIVAPTPVSATVVSRAPAPAPAPVPTQAPAPVPVAVAVGPVSSPANSGGSKRGAPGPVAGGDSTRGAPAGGSARGGPRGGGGGGPAGRGGPGGGSGSARGARGAPGPGPAAGSGGSARGSPAGAARGGGAGMPSAAGQGQGAKGGTGGTQAPTQAPAQPAAVAVGETKPAVSKIYRPGPAAGGRKRDDPNTRTVYSAMPDFDDSDEE